MSRYEVQLEIAGPLAMFARPDTGGTPTSYPAPTWAAAKAIFESIARFGEGNAWIAPTRVELCRRKGVEGGAVAYQRYATNYGGPLRKSDLLRKDASMQLFATILSDVCYRLYGTVEGTRAANGRNPRHHLQDLFQRRLKRGQCFSTPALGWKEFTCSYWGAFREVEYEVDTALNIEIPSMLFSVWDRPCDGQYAPRFAQNVRIASGVLHYVE